jgi:hypothetical protein
MSERKSLEFFLLRYVPNVARGEFVNIGLIMKESSNEGGFAAVHFTQNLKRARCLDPFIDEDLLIGIGREIENRFQDSSAQLALLAELVDQYSNVIQLSPMRRCTAEDPAKEMTTLIASLVEASFVPPMLDGKPEAVEKKSGRRWIRSQMSQAFWAQGLRGFVHEKLAAAPYTNEADDFTLDFSYAHGNEIKFFQAVSLVEAGMETLMFPLRAAKIASGFRKIRPETPRFTAVVEDQFDGENKDVKMAMAFMKDEDIQIERAAEMPRIAKQASLELGL